MCEFCEKSKTIIDKEYLDSWIIGWPDAKITAETATYSTDVIFIDRGFLRLADRDDCQCMDHGSKIKINFCPFCGKKQMEVE